MLRTLILAAALGLAAAPAASAQQTGVVHATCNVQGTPAQMVLQYTRYRDTVVWQDRHGTNSEAIDMQQWGPTHWEGYVDTQYGRYRLTGENNFIEAWPVGGVYSDMVTYEVTQTGPMTFLFTDFYNGGSIPCQITSQ